MLRPPVVASAALAMAFALAASTVTVAEDADGPLTVYSGRSETLVGPLLESFSEATGIDVAVKYAGSSELAAILLEEGERSPADVFFSQDAGALGAVADAGLLTALPEETLARVPAAYRDAAGEWVGVSGRARTVAYTTSVPVELPDSILGFTDPAWSRRIGWVPSNASFQSFVTALRVVEGEDVARSWLEGILANDPVAYPENSTAVEGVAAGEVDVAFVNHYYLLQLLAEHGDDYPVAQAFFADGDVGSLVNVAGIGQLTSSDQPAAASSLIDYLLGEEAQSFFSETTYEYPLVDGIPVDPRLPALDTLGVPEIDLSALADLQGTVELLRDVGAID